MGRDSSSSSRSRSRSRERKRRKRSRSSDRKKSSKSRRDRSRSRKRSRSRSRDRDSKRRSRDRHSKSKSRKRSRERKEKRRSESPQKSVREEMERTKARTREALAKAEEEIEEKPLINPNLPSKVVLNLDASEMAINEAEMRRIDEGGFAQQTFSSSRSAAVAITDSAVPEIQNSQNKHDIAMFGEAGQSWRQKQGVKKEAEEETPAPNPYALPTAKQCPLVNPALSSDVEERKRAWVEKWKRLRKEAFAAMA